MAIFLLVHGMFHGGWCFDKLKPLLEKAGHRVMTPDLAGCGGDKTPATEVSLERWARDIAALATDAPEPVILLGHSRGGYVASQAAELAPDRVAALVYLTALMLPHGATTTSLFTMMAEDGIEVVEMITPKLSGDGLLLLPPDDFAELLYGACSPEIRAWAVPQVRGEPVAPIMTPLSLSAARYGRLPKIYVETTKDRTLPIGAQRAMIARGKPDEVITMETDHMPIVTDLDEMAAILNDVAARYGARRKMPA